MNNFEFMRYMPFVDYTSRDVYLQRIDPRAFLMGLLFLMIGFIFCPSVVGLLICILVTLAGVWLSHIPLQVYLKGVWAAMPLILALAVINGLLNTLVDTPPILIHWKSLVISLADLMLSLKLILRFIALILLISLGSSNISTSSFIQGLKSMLSPLQALGLPVQDFIVSIEIAVRFIPILTQTAERIAKAQASRGAVWGTGKGNLNARIRQVIPVLLPLMMQSLQKTESLSLAMESRGFGALPVRTSYSRSEFRSSDGWFILVCGMLTAIVLFVPLPF